MLNETFTVIFKHRVVMMMLKLLGATCRNETLKESLELKECQHLDDFLTWLLKGR